MPMRVERGILKVDFPTSFLVLSSGCFVPFCTSTSHRPDKKISGARSIDPWLILAVRCAYTSFAPVTGALSAIVYGL